MDICCREKGRRYAKMARKKEVLLKAKKQKSTLETKAQAGAEKSWIVTHESKACDPETLRQIYERLCEIR